jgi:uncharacterized protein
LIGTGPPPAARTAEGVIDVAWTGMSGIAPVPGYVVMQPTTLCNLDCTYCYLPERALDRRMPVEVASAVAESVNDWAAGSPRFSVVWHGGEPLAAGRPAFAALLAPFHGVEHHVQTNATMIDDEWCEFFGMHEVRVSVSVDGPAARNDARVNRGGAAAYPRIERGIAALRRHGVPFSALCVVSDPRPELAAELYDYFLDLGCDVLGINIEEKEGVNARPNAHAETAVREFWAGLVAAWRRAPRIHVREIEYALRYAGAVLDGSADGVLPRRLDPIPTIAVDGRVFVLSPELAGFSDVRYGNFSSGNVLSTSLRQILREASARTAWVGEFLAGVEACRETCAYFGFCGGGHAANRYFEQGRFDGTETDHCRNTKIRLLEGVLDHAATN